MMTGGIGTDSVDLPSFPCHRLSSSSIEELRLLRSRLRKEYLKVDAILRHRLIGSAYEEGS